MYQIQFLDNNGKWNATNSDHKPYLYKTTADAWDSLKFWGVIGAKDCGESTQEVFGEYGNTWKARVVEVN